jgi:putative transposase
MNISFSPERHRYSFDRHDRVAINGTTWRPHQCTEEGWIMASDLANGICNMFTHAEIGRYMAAGRIHREPGYYLPESARRRLENKDVLISQLSDAHRQRISTKSAYVQAFFDMERDGLIQRTDHSINANIDELTMRAMRILVAKSRGTGKTNAARSVVMPEPPSARTLRRWLKAMETRSESGLIDAVHRRGNRNRFLGADELSLMLTGIRSHLSPDRPTIEVTYERIRRLFRERNAERDEKALPPLTIPSKETVRQAIRKIDPFVLTMSREGRDVARKKFAPIGTGLELTRPLERVEIDENTMDLMSIMALLNMDQIFSPEERESLGLDGNLGRWTITMAICSTTRCIVGLIISQNPGALAAVRTLQMITTDKGQWADAVGALSSWDMHGTPEVIVTDCGSAFKSDAFRFACSDLGIAVERTIAGVPEMRGRIERVFQTVSMGLLPRLSGRTFSDIITKGDADPRQRAVLSLDDVIFALIRWVVDIYHNTPHSGLGGETPVDCWRRLTAEWGIQPPPGMRMRRVVFGTKLKRKISKSGLRVMGIHYHSEAVALAMMSDVARTVEVRWHPDDIGAVEVNLKGQWIEVPAVQDVFHGRSARSWLAAMRELKASRPDRREFAEQTVSAAIKAIEARNSAALMKAGLLAEDWSEARIEHEESRVFIGFKTASDHPQPGSDKLPGRSLNTNSKKERRHKANNGPAAGGSWTLEEGE